MKYLLDTHTFLWYFWDSKDLSECASEIIENNAVEKYVSGEFKPNLPSAKMR